MANSKPTYWGIATEGTQVPKFLWIADSDYNILKKISPVFNERGNFTEKVNETLFHYEKKGLDISFIKMRTEDTPDESFIQIESDKKWLIDQQK